MADRADEAAKLALGAPVGVGGRVLVKPYSRETMFEIFVGVVSAGAAIYVIGGLAFKWYRATVGRQERYAGLLARLGTRVQPTFSTETLGMSPAV